MSVLSPSSSQASISGLGIIVLLLLFFTIGKFKCTLPRVEVITVPTPPPPNGCDENIRLDDFSKRFKRPNDVEQVIRNYMKSNVNSKKRIFTLGEVLKAIKGPGNTINPKFFEYLSSCYGVGISMLNEIFDSLTSCGGFNGPKPNFKEMLKKFKEPMPKPKVPTTPKEHTPPKNPKRMDDAGDDELWWLE